MEQTAIGNVPNRQSIQVTKLSGKRMESRPPKGSSACLVPCEQAPLPASLTRLAHGWGKNHSRMPRYGDQAEFLPIWEETAPRRILEPRGPF